MKQKIKINNISDLPFAGDIAKPYPANSIVYKSNFPNTKNTSLNHQSIFKKWFNKLHAKF